MRRMRNKNFFLASVSRGSEGPFPHWLRMGQIAKKVLGVPCGCHKVQLPLTLHQTYFTTKQRETIRLMSNSTKIAERKNWGSTGARKNAAKTPQDKKVQSRHYTHDAGTWAAEARAGASAPHRARARDRASREEA
jgi:hypothetical protein